MVGRGLLLDVKLPGVGISGGSSSFCKGLLTGGGVRELARRSDVWTSVNKLIYRIVLCWFVFSSMQQKPLTIMASVLRCKK